MNRAPVIQLQPLLDRQPPVAHEAEAAVLGSMLIDAGCVGDVVAIVGTSEAFYSEANQAIYSALVDQAEHGGDFMTVAHQLADDERLEAVGGREYIIQLAGSVPSSVNAQHYAKIVSAKHRMRRLIQASGEIIHDVYEHNTAVGQDAEDLLARAEARVSDIRGDAKNLSTTKSMGELAAEHLREALAREEAAKDGKTSPLGLRTGYTDLDWMIRGGLRPGQMIVIGARPSMGKTTLGMNIAENIATGKRQLEFGAESSHAPVWFCSLEMTADEIFERWVASQARVSSDRYAGGDLKDYEWESFIAATKDAQSMPLHIDDAPGVSIQQLRLRARAMVRKHGVRLIIVDYVQLMTVADTRGKNRNEIVGECSRGLKALAKELRVPVIALAQLNRGAEHRDNGRPRASDLRESGSLEQDADIIMLLHREAQHRKEDPEWDPKHQSFNELNREKLRDAELIIAKQRNGPTGIVELLFIAEETRFKNRRVR